MAPLTFADTHNMVAYLSKSDASKGFDQILDFLNASTIRYALTVNPTIYVSCIKQFWSTAKVKTVNGVVQLQALIYGKKVFVSEAIIKRDLHLEEAEGVECLPYNEIFKELTRIGMVRNVDSSAKFLMYPRFIQVFLDNQVDDMTSHHTKYTSPALTQKVFANMRRVSKGFSGNETPLFDTMLFEEKLEKRRKSKPSVLRRLRKIGSATRVESSEEAIVKPAETGVSAALNVKFSVAEPVVTTINLLVTTDSVTIIVAEPVSAAAKELTDNDITMAKALAELKTSKPKVVTTVPILNSVTTITTIKLKA
ncbi:hypothetical protein Tco_0741395, partial [Tanacetum coccineum]